MRGSERTETIVGNTADNTLQGRGGLYANGDGNCCPSRHVNVRLALRGDSLVLLDYRIEPAPQQ